MTGPIRQSVDKNKPPRPPNAWILYRSDKSREMQLKDPSAPRRVQADVSKFISLQWKAEPPEVRAAYEQLADVKKAEHHAKFPNYRFQPVKKEVKDAIREAQRQEKRDKSKKGGRARQQPSSEEAKPVPLPYRPFIFSQDGYFNPGGPSPPLSAASSPKIVQSTPPHHANNRQLVFQPLDASYPYPSGRIASGGPTVAPIVTSAPYTQPLQMPIAAPRPLVAQLPTPAPSQWEPSAQWQPTQDASATSPIWPGSSGRQVSGGAQAQEYVTFNVPPSIQQNMSGWIPGNFDDPFEDPIQALLSATADPSIFQLSNFNPDQLLTNPEGEIEVSMGQMPYPMPDYSMDLDLSSFIQSTQMQSAEVSPQDLTMMFSTSRPIEPPQRDFSADNEIFQYLNLDPVLRDDDTQAPAYPTPSPQERQSAPKLPAPTPYTPPAGAAFSSTRRVAASWKQPFTAGPDSPIDHSPPRQWGVQAS